MKRVLVTMVIAPALTIMILGSCKKENVSGEPPACSTPCQQFRDNLVADRWVRSCDPLHSYYGECTSEHQLYVDDISAPFLAGRASCDCTIKVYLTANGKEIEISNSKITFMGNELWATTTHAGIKITCKCATPNLPFTSLNLAIVIS